jgi:DNA primase
MISPDSIDRVREQADIAEIIGEYVKLKRTGSQYRGPCPLHGGKNPNFSVSPDKGVFHCFTCGESGDVFTFLQKHLGVDYPTSIRMIADRYGVELKETTSQRTERDWREPLWETNAAAAAFYQRALWESPEGSAARAYLASRDISRDVADRFGLGYAPNGRALRTHLNTLGYDDDRLVDVGLLVKKEGEGEGDAFLRFRDRLVIPIMDTGGKPVGFGGRLLEGDGKATGAAKYLNSPETRLFQKRRNLFNLHAAKGAIRKTDRVLIVEGYFDVVRLVAAGFEGVVAGLGTALTEEQAALIMRMTRNVFLLYDSDEAGQKATFRAGLEMLRAGAAVRVVSLPAGEDPDTFVRTGGAPALEGALAGAIDIFERQVQILERRGWLADLHHRRRAIDKLLPTIRAVADPLTKDIYITRVAEAAGVEKALVQREVDEGETRSGVRRRPRPADDELVGDAPPGENWREDEGGRPPFRPRNPNEWKGGKSFKGGRFKKRGDEWLTNDVTPKGRKGDGRGAERYLLIAMLHARGEIERVAERGGGETFRDPEYRAIFAALLQNPEADAETLAAALSETQTRVLQELLAAHEALGNVARTVEDSLVRLQARDLDDRMADLENEMRIASDAEKDAILREKQKLMSERRALSDIGKRFGKSGF